MGVEDEVESSGFIGDAGRLRLEKRELESCGLVSLDCVAVGAEVDVKERGVVPEKNV